MKTSRFSGGLFFLFIGVILLGINFGWWNIDLWNALANFWPVILILIGLRMILPNSVIYTFVALLIFAAVLALSSTNMIPKNGSFSFFSNGPLISEVFSKPLEPTTTSAKYKLDLGALDLSIRALATDSNELYSGSSLLNKNLSIKDLSSVQGEKNIKFSENARSIMIPSKKRSFDLALSPKIPTEVDLNTGAIKSELDLRSLKISKLSLDSGASNETVSLGNLIDNVEVYLNTGASKYTINLPKEYSLTIISDSGAVSDNFGTLGLNKTGNTYKSSDWDTNTKKIKIDISSGASSIDIIRY